MKLIGYSSIVTLLVVISILNLTGHYGRAEHVAQLVVLGIILLCIRLFKPSPTTPVLPTLFSVRHYILALGVLLVVFSSIIFTSRLSIGHDSNYLSQSAYATMPLIPQTWETTLGGTDLGHNQVISMWMQPVHIVLALAGRLGVTFPVQFKLLVLAQLVVGVYGVFKLTGFWGMSNWAKSTLAVFFFTTTYCLTLIDGGLVFLGAAYALFPWLIYLLTTSQSLGLATLVLVISSYFDIRIIPLAFAASLCLKPTKRLLLIFSLSILGHAFWLVPALLSPSGATFGLSSTPLQFTLYTLGHVLFFSQPHWYSNYFGYVQPVAWYLVLLPILVISALFNRPGSHMKSFALLTLIGLLLCAGWASPWLARLPGFVIFRDPSKFSFLQSLGYLGLLGITITSWGKKNLLVIIYFVVCAWPVYTGHTTGSFAIAPLAKVYADFATSLDASGGFSRLLWLPAKPAVAQISPYHIWTDGLALLAKRPLQTSNIGEYDLLNYLQTDQAPGLLSATSIGHIVYPLPDQRVKSLKPEDLAYYHWQLAWFKSRPWLTDISPHPDLPVFQSHFAADHLYTLNQVIWVVGPDDTYATLSHYPGFSPATSGLVHLNSYHTLSHIQPTDLVLFNRTNPLDLVLSQAQPADLFSWAPPPTTFSGLKSYLFTRYAIDFHDHDMGRGYTLIEGPQTTGRQTAWPSGNLFARVLTSRAGELLTVSVNGTAHQVTTYSPQDVMTWVNLGQVASHPHLQITTTGQLNLINAFAVLSDTTYKRYADQAYTVLYHTPTAQITNLPLTSPVSDQDFVYTFAATTASPAKMLIASQPLVVATPASQVSYHSLSPTNYSLTLSGQPGWVVFADSFDTNWQINSTGSVPVLDMLNGFYLTPGTYALNYFPQAYVLPGLLVTAVTLLLLMGKMILWKK